MSNMPVFSGDIRALLNCMPTNENNFNYLIRLMQRNVVVPFIGAGVSKNFGYPLWDEFLEELATNHNLPKAKDLIAAGQLEKAAALLEENLQGSMEYSLIQKFGNHDYKAPENFKELELIPRIFRNLILTTNFDEVIETLYSKVNNEYIDKITPRTLRDITLSQKRIACGEPTLIKLHGDVGLREFVLTERSYNAIYGERVLDIRLPLPSFLRDVLLSRIILFLGCGLKDDRTLHVVEQSQIYGSISFAFLELPVETENKNNPWEPYWYSISGNNEIEAFTKRKQFLHAHNIIPIWYPYKKHDSLKIFLKEIENRIGWDGKFSATVSWDRVEELIDEGNKLEERGEFEQAFYFYKNAEDTIEKNASNFPDKIKLRQFEKIKGFYVSSGYVFESKKIIKDILKLMERILSPGDCDLAMQYHALGYVYERFYYYELMLKAMQKAYMIFQTCGDIENNKKLLNNAAVLYTSLGYAYLKNANHQNAIKMYENAKKLLEKHNDELGIDAKAFVLNGLTRYYEIKNDNKNALETLGKALVLRKRFYDEEKNRGEKASGALNHLINTYINKIRIFLKEKELDKANRELEEFENKYGDIYTSSGDLRITSGKVYRARGDILQAQGAPLLAYAAYHESLMCRQYLHAVDDVYTAELLLKMAQCLKQVEERKEEALEYMIQAYVIYNKNLGGDHLIVEEIRKNQIEKLRVCLKYTEDVVWRRIACQEAFLDYRYDKRIIDREKELIKYFEL